MTELTDTGKGLAVTSRRRLPREGAGSQSLLLLVSNGEIEWPSLTFYRLR
jgi:hypothetical protein